MPEQYVYAPDTLRRFMEQALTAARVPAADGAIIADNLIKAELWGLATHGVSRFPVYFKRILAGTINPRPEVKITSSWPAVLAVDGDNGQGAVVTVRAIAAAMPVAGKFGLAVAGVRSTNHFGAAGYFCDLAAQKGFVAVLMADSAAAIPPWGGKEAYFGTNPIAVGLPRRGEPPVVVDLATSIVARGKIIAAARKGEAIPEGWALDKDGFPTTSAADALAGTLLPMAGPKGYGLALMVEHLAGVMTGAAFGREVAWQYSEKQEPGNVGNILILIRPDAFISGDDYYARTERFCQEIKACEKAAGVDEIYLPGDRRHILEQVLAEKGIEIPAGLRKDLMAIAETYCLELNEK